MSFHIHHDSLVWGFLDIKDNPALSLYLANFGWYYPIESQYLGERHTYSNTGTEDKIRAVQGIISYLTIRSNDLKKLCYYFYIYITNALQFIKYPQYACPYVCVIYVLHASWCAAQKWLYSVYEVYYINVVIAIAQGSNRQMSEISYRMWCHPPHAPYLGFLYTAIFLSFVTMKITTVVHESISLCKISVCI